MIDRCQRILPKFNVAAGKVWRNWNHLNIIEQKDGPVVRPEGKPSVVLMCEEKTVDQEHLASLSQSVHCNPMAIDDALLRFCTTYTLQLSPRIDTLNEAQLERLMRHEAIHMGYKRHDRNFIELAEKKGACFSELSIDECKVRIEVKVGSRFKEVMCASTYEEAKRLSHQYSLDHPGERVRISM